MYPGSFWWSWNSLGTSGKVEEPGTASKHNRGFVEELGVTHIDYTKEDFSEILNKYSGGIEAAFDSRGGRDLIKAANVVKKNGIIVSYGFSGNDYGGTLETVKGVWSLLRIGTPPKRKTSRFVEHRGK